ncbi:hypothetical protein QFC21_001814 [Naganishia friedmannii]|uniref:Uncharacterized protein n=1 Tax=Naganishia friedmannii TaxID=89922 RepID=A0ACC2W196_9TREE|nr:hypothetical protein QFC21_001814 [Naganishia friedmannii]
MATYYFAPLAPISAGAPFSEYATIQNGPPDLNQAQPQVPETLMSHDQTSNKPMPELQTADSWPTLNDAVVGKKPALVTSASAPSKNDNGNDFSRPSPLRGDAEFFMPRTSSFQQHSRRAASENFANADRQPLHDDNRVPWPKTPQPMNAEDRKNGMHFAAQTTFSAASTMSTIDGVSSGLASQLANASREDQDFPLHLLSSFSPFDEEEVPKSNGFVVDPPATEVPATNKFPSVYGNVAEPRVRSMFPNTRSSSGSSIWSTETAVQRSRLVPPSPKADWHFESKGNTVQDEDGSPFSSKRTTGDDRMFTLEDLWDESPVKQLSKAATTTNPYGGFNNQLWTFNEIAPTIMSGSMSIMDDPTPSLRTRSAIGLELEGPPKLDSGDMVTVPLPPPPGLPSPGITGVSELRSMEEIEEKMRLLQEQSSGLAGELIQQASRIQASRLQMEATNNQQDTLSQTTAMLRISDPVSVAETRAGTSCHNIVPVLLEGSADLFHPSTVKNGAAGGQKLAQTLLRGVEVAFQSVNQNYNEPPKMVVHVLMQRHFSLPSYYHYSTSEQDPSDDQMSFAKDSRRKGRAYLPLPGARIKNRLGIVYWNLGLEDIKSFIEDSKGRPTRLHLCNPTLMARENASVGFASLRIPGIFVRENTLEISFAENDDEGMQSVSESDDQNDEEDWEREEASCSSSSDNEPVTPSVIDANKLPLVKASTFSSTMSDETKKDPSNAFIPVVNRHKNFSHISKVGVRLAVVTSDEFERLHSSSTRSSRDRVRRAHRGTSALKATTLVGTATSATYRDVDYQNMKKLNPRPCHKHYLSAKGCRDDCAFSHTYELTQNELTAVRVLAREMPCPYHLNGGKCPHDVRDIALPSFVGILNLLRLLCYSNTRASMAIFALMRAPALCGLKT